jgi:hypothetical protein
LLEVGLEERRVELRGQVARSNKSAVVDSKRCDRARDLAANLDRRDDF